MRANSGAEEAETQSCEPDSTRPRKPAASSGEPVKLHKAGGIKNELPAALAGTHVLWWSKCWQGGALQIEE